MLIFIVNTFRTSEEQTTKDKMAGPNMSFVERFHYTDKCQHYYIKNGCPVLRTGRMGKQVIPCIHVSVIMNYSITIIDGNWETKRIVHYTCMYLYKTENLH